MEGLIINFRQGRHSHYTNHIIIKIDGVEKREDAEKLIDKKVVFKTKKGQINGIVRSTHGNKGCLRVLFERGLPGQAISKKVLIE